jgi:hypothetical protein
LALAVRGDGRIDARAERTAPAKETDGIAGFSHDAPVTNREVPGNEHAVVRLAGLCRDLGACAAEVLRVATARSPLIAPI